MDRAILHKTKNIFERVTGKRIKLRFLDIRRPAVEIKERSAEILMPKYYDNFYYRSFEHELSHIVFKSPNPNVITNEICNAIGSSYYSTIVRIILNIIEDYRVDWMWNKFYYGSKIVREEQLKAVAKDLITSDHIVDILNAVRCDPEMVSEVSDPELREVCKEFLKILKTVEGKSWKASVVATIKTLKLINKYIRHEIQPKTIQPKTSVVKIEQGQGESEEQELGEGGEEEGMGEVEIEKEEQEGGEGIGEREEGEEEQEVGEEEGRGKGKRESKEEEEGEEEEGEGEEGERGQGNSEEQEGEEKEGVGEGEEQEGEEQEQESLEKMLSKLDNEELRKIAIESEYSMSDVPTNTNELTTASEIRYVLEKTVEEIEEEAEREGQRMLKDIEKKLKTIKKVNLKNLEQKGIFARVDDRIEQCTRYTDPNAALANRIALALNRIRDKQRISNDVVGLEIDIDEVIKHKITKNGQPFESEETETGFDIVVLLDASGSMEGNRIRIASSACATLFLALQKVRNVNMKVIAFNSEKGGSPVHLRELKTMDEICCVYPRGYTPTWAAVHYAVNLLNKSTAQKKMIVLITDGVPESGSHPESVVFQWTREAIFRARRANIDVYTLFIEPEVDKRTIKKVFGPEWTWEQIEDIEQLPKHLLNFVINKLVRR